MMFNTLKMNKYNKEPRILYFFFSVLFIFLWGEAIINQKRKYTVEFSFFMPSFKNKQKKIYKKSKRLGSLRRKGIREYAGGYVHSDSDQEQPLEQQNTNEEG